jgi:type I restriction enzyme S subunit
VRLCNYLDVYDNLQITSDLDFMEATASRDEILRFAVQPGDVVMTKDSETPDDIGVPAVCVESISDLVCGYHLALIRPIQEEVDASFLADQIAHRRIGRYFRLHANGTTRFGLTTSTIEDTPLWLPPLGEQRHIAEILDAADEAIRRTERVIAKLKEIKKGLLHDLLTRGLDTEGNLRDPEAHPEQFKDSPVGTIPRGWTAATLGDVVSQTKGFIQTGPFGSQLHADEYTREGIPVVMPQNIENGRVRGRDVARVAPETARALARHRVTDNDVVFARRGDLSRCASIGEREEGWLCGTGCLLVRSPRDEISGDWLAAVYRNTLCQRQIHENAVGSTMVNLNTSLLASLIIPKPPYPEQLSIVEAIATYDTPIRAEESMLHKLREVKRGLMDDLLTGRLRV